METSQYDDKIQKVSLKTWRRVFSVLRTLKKPIIILIIFAIILGFFDAAMNLLNVYAIEHFIESQDFTTFKWFIVVNVTFAFSFGILVWLFIRQGTMIESRVSYYLRKEAFENLQRLSFDFFDQTPQGWIMARMTSDARRLSNIISWALLDFFWAILFMVFTTIILFVYSWKLALIVLASVPVMFLIAIIFRKKILTVHRRSRKYNSIATSKYSEAFLGAKTTKTLVVEEENLSEFKEVTRNLRNSSIKAITISSLFSSLLLVATYITVGLVMIQGGSLVINNMIKISTLFLFIRAVTNFFDPVIMLTQIMSNVQEAQASAERIVELIEKKPSITDSDEVVLKYGTKIHPNREVYEPIIGDIKYQDLNFYYKEGETIFNNFNLEIKAGSKVALVGYTGSGKTTLINLLARFYEPINGKILIDGIDYKERSLDWLHTQIGYVLQTPHLFSQTIKENILYGKLDATDEEVIEVCQLIGIHDFIMKTEKGYDTFVGEGGNLLSLGQKQLISFARALINDPKILLLDEATSSVDSESEKMIQEATKVLLENRTSIVVAHRLSTIVDSDLIVMLEAGKIVEMGKHEELLKLRGKYYELYRNQFINQLTNI